MKQEHLDYLNSLDISGIIKDRVEKIVTENIMLCSGKLDILDIFLCDITNAESIKSYTSLWLFSSDYFIECKNFLFADDYDAVFYPKSIYYCSLKKSNYDLLTANVTSQITIQCNLKTLASCTMITTGLNCEKAVSIYQKYMLPNFL